jgi:hypothetical protein
MKSLSQSETILEGKLFSQYHLSKKILASLSAMSEQVVGIIQMSEPNLSVMVSMQSYPLSLGSRLMKSIAMASHHLSGTGSG